MIKAQEYQQRRSAVREMLDAPAVFAAYDAMQLSGDMAAPFLQEANFLWLSGVAEPGWMMIVAEEGDVLIAPERDEMHIVFDGGMSLEEAQAVSGVDQVYDHQQGNSYLTSLLSKHAAAWALGADPHQEWYDFSSNPAMQRIYQYLSERVSSVKDCRSVLAKLRAIKAPTEIAAIQQAIDETARALDAIERALRSGTVAHEYELQAIADYEFRVRGAAGHAYAPIVAGGKNACTLHYDANRMALAPGQLVLLDIGARWDGYAADITRTFATTVASMRQQSVFERVAKAQREIIALIGPGKMVREYQDESDAIMRQALIELGLYETEKDFRRYYPHAIGHGLGLDVHELLGGYDAFQPGMVLTVEPGIYIPDESIGVRIEDDILVTSDGHTILSSTVPIRL